VGVTTRGFEARALPPAAVSQRRFGGRVFFWKKAGKMLFPKMLWKKVF